MQCHREQKPGRSGRAGRGSARTEAQNLAQAAKPEAKELSAGVHLLSHRRLEVVAPLEPCRLYKPRPSDQLQAKPTAVPVCLQAVPERKQWTGSAQGRLHQLQGVVSGMLVFAELFGIPARISMDCQRL